MEGEGNRNAYTCEMCGHTHYTLTRASGVTPVFIRCRAFVRASQDRLMYRACDGRAVSHMYHVPDDAPDPTWEWYRPTSGDPVLRDPSMRRHVEDGGLVMRAISSSVNGGA